MADKDILALNQLIQDYGTEYRSPDRPRMPMRERLYAGYTPATGVEQAEMILSMLPGVGEGLDAAHMAKDVEEGDYGQAGLSGLAMLLPGIGAGVIKKLYHGSPSIGQIIPDPKKAVETKGAAFLTDNDDIAHTFTLPREYGEPKFYDNFGNEIEPGDVTEIYTDIKNPFTLKGDNAQKFIDDSSYQQKVINQAKDEGFDSVIAENVYEGIGERYKGDVYAVFNKEQMTLDAPKQAIKPVKLREGPPIKIGDTMQPSLLTSDGETPEVLYRIVSRKEFDKAQESGKLTPSSFYGRIHASSSPDMRYKNAPDDVVIKIKYDPDDGWYSKHSSDEVYGVTEKDIPISRISKIKQFKKGGSVVSRDPYRRQPRTI